MNIFVLLAVAAVGGLLGFLAAALFYAYHARRRKAKRGAARKKVEFIKLVLMLVMATYFLGVAVGVKIVLEYPEQLGTLLAYIGAPTATVIIFYAWKAKAENVIKIKKNNPDSLDSVSDSGNL